MTMSSQQKQKAKPIKKQIQWEKARWQQEKAQLIANIEQEVSSANGFLPDLLCSTHINARKVLGSTTTECYFTHPTKSSCHDLTVDRSTSQAAKQVLGLGGKFIVKPEYTTAKCQVRGLLERLQRVLEALLEPE